MLEKTLNLGKLESTHGIAPAYMMRAVVVASLSFVFFLLMLAGFYIRQNVGYFLLSTAFLVVYVLTMFGWLAQRRKVLKVYENGFSYKKFAASWDEIDSIDVKTVKRAAGGAELNCEVTKTGGDKVILSEVIHDCAKVVGRISAEIEKRSRREQIS
ncbi:MAG: hypothetical protein WA584_10810 [Pyrinomonadaceae bacterium]